ncbi:MAG: hypothetical protein AAF211_13260 [Myxococcota bacterium]
MRDIALVIVSILFLLVGGLAHAIVSWGNPGGAAIGVAGPDLETATTASATMTWWPCDSDIPVIQYTETEIDLIEGWLGESSSAGPMCSVDLDFDETIDLDGTSAGGAFALAIAPTTVTLTPTEPKVGIAYTVTSGSYTGTLEIGVTFP